MSIVIKDGVDTIEVMGAERAYGHHLMEEVAFGALRVDELPAGGHPHPIRDHVQGRRRRNSIGTIMTADISDLTSCPVGPQFNHALKAHLTGFRHDVVIVKGEGADERRIVGMEFLANTALVTGSGPVALLARIHSHCEVHAWVAGHDRAWLAGIIRQGRGTGILRAGMGWEEATMMLEKTDERDVVISDSIGEVFPTQDYAEFDPSELPEHKACQDQLEDDQDEYENCDHEDAWYDLDPKVRWEMALKNLKERPRHPHLQIAPGNLNEPIFAPYLHAHNLYQH